MRLRPVILAAAGCLSIGLVTGTATVATAAPATIVAGAAGWGPDTIMAYNNATIALNHRHTGCANVHLSSSTPNRGGWQGD